MKTTKGKEKYTILKLDYDNQKDIWLKSTYTLRRLIGILGILLPLLLPLLLYLTDDLEELLPSISHYYYTKSGPLFIAIMSLLAIFFIVYKGNVFIDFIISSITGISALLVVLLPTDSLLQGCLNISKKHIITILEKDPTREVTHYISAGIFLLSLAYMSIFRFTKTSEGYEDSKKQIDFRHKIYRILGVIMIFSIILIFLGSDYFNKIVPNSFHDFHKTHHLTFWLETIAVECFGISWLIKGGEFKLKK
ncbi:hypothetical protein SY27_13640 [Flavobacterium sp. 316]|uniref:hypothetical protein n=1 Tax=Flavobacterium sp. 316 TaxID=1603293 RepID=UPI0005E31ECA|nr:hypothetical protein [Flavobacterium sp. 316]KIX20186.1 hypothetical protein SY27_13640 [Flavobacterium sp. 316]